MGSPDEGERKDPTSCQRWSLEGHDHSYIVPSSPSASVNQCEQGRDRGAVLDIIRRAACIRTIKSVSQALGSPD
jgi:hypothetical protein